MIVRLGVLFSLLSLLALSFSMDPPVPERGTHIENDFGVTFDDQFFYLRNISDPRTMPLVLAEQNYTLWLLQQQQSLSHDIYDELTAITNEFESVGFHETLAGDYLYYNDETYGTFGAWFRRPATSLHAATPRYFVAETDSMVLDLNLVAQVFALRVIWCG